MSYIKGKFTKILYQNEDTNYMVALFRVRETDDEEVRGFVNKTISTNGIILDPRLNYTYTLMGNYVKHPKYDYQYSFTSYERQIPTTTSDIVDFLASPFVEGCGDIIAKKIVDKFGADALVKIREDVNNLLEIKGMTMIKAMKIYKSVVNFEQNDKIIAKLKEIGFSLEDASKIISKHNMDIEDIINGNLYILKDIFEFKKLDDIYKNYYDPYSPLRCKECILESMLELSFNEGSTYYSKEDIYKALSVFYNLNLENSIYEQYLDELKQESEIIIINDKYYLNKYYNEEKDVAHMLYKIAMTPSKKVPNLDGKIAMIENELGFKYNDEQKKAITMALNNNVAIISGGPGTGKTTIINAIVQLYISEYKLNSIDILENICLLAPTGRASKRLAVSTNLPASTIHRKLKWHKDSDSFEYDINNKLTAKLVIVDETSMIDISLMYNLLCALNENVKLILVGDIYQLPSVGPGLVLQDLINSDLFSYTPLNIIYRQSDNSYIPFLAKDIKMHNLDDEYLYKRDDYNFIVAKEEDIMEKIIASVKYALAKGINENRMQILAPVYKGQNGIYNLNVNLQKIYNPEDPNKAEIKYGDKIYRENDKVLQLVNDSDNQVFNGDIGKILSIGKNKLGKTEIRIDFDGNIVFYEKKDLKSITHAYAITIHKSQGSEFEHVLMPVCKSYYIMLYNKLLYTGVSRAKKSLTIIGDPSAFIQGIENNYASERRTSLISHLMYEFNA